MSTEEIEASFKHGVERYIFVSVVILPAPRRRPETLHDTKEKPLTQQELTELALSRKDSP